MFTGIVEERGRVKGCSPPVLTLHARITLDEGRVGDSIAVNGACLTITSLQGDCFSVGVSPETLRRTNLGGLKPGDFVNLERALAYGGRLGGHLVQGHVDGTGRVVSIKPEGESFLYSFEIPTSLGRYIVEKGFVAVDGVSLTVVERWPSGFSVTVIPYTHEQTTLGLHKPGSLVNLEIDILAKYVERMLEGQRKA